MLLAKLRWPKHKKRVVIIKTKDGCYDNLYYLVEINFITVTSNENRFPG